jgi:hypothetical protein
MIATMNQKVVQVIAPRAILDDASWTTVEIDTKGFRHCTIYFMLGATDIDISALKVQESDTAGSGHADITGLVCSGTTGDARLPTATDDNLIFAFQIDLRGRKRYLDLVATIANGSTGGFAAAWAVLSRAEEMPNTVAERGLAGELKLPA